MSESTSEGHVQANSHPEGSPDNREQQEPVSPLRTSTIPAIQDTAAPRTGDTGRLTMMHVGIEGRDDDNEQDASLTKDETKLDTKAETNKMQTTRPTVPVLIVEDTVELAEVIQATIEGMGLEAIYETHGKTGLDRLKELNPFLVMLDIGLPDITGWKMLDHIKEHYTDREDEMPTIIIITAYGDPANRLIGKLQNIHSYLLKPFTPDQVEAAVGMVLRGEKHDDPTGMGDHPSTV